MKKSTQGLIKCSVFSQATLLAVFILLTILKLSVFRLTHKSQLLRTNEEL